MLGDHKAGGYSLIIMSLYNNNNIYRDIYLEIV